MVGWCFSFPFLSFYSAKEMGSISLFFFILEISDFAINDDDDDDDDDGLAKGRS